MNNESNKHWGQVLYGVTTWSRCV